MKRIYLLALLLYFGVTISAKPGGVFNHVFNVAQYNDWGRGYLTITDNFVAYSGDNTITMTWETEIGGKMIYPGTIITGINGKSAKNMTPNEFYALTDNADSFMLKFILPYTDGSELEQQIIVLQEVPKEVATVWMDFCYHNLYDTQIHRRAETGKKADTNFKELHDNSFDFSKIRTYDYIIIGNDPLTDMSILDNVPKWGMERDTISPDVLFTIAKQAEQSISATYIPPTSRTVNTGSYTTTSYNYITKRYDYITRQNNQTIREGGYTATTSVAHLYLELAMLDAKQINNPKINHAPIIWQMTAKRDVVNPKFDIEKEVRDYASWAQMPPIDRNKYYANKEIYETTGLIADVNNPRIINQIIKDSKAERSGFEEGDEVISYSWKGYKRRMTKSAKETNDIVKSLNKSYEATRNNISVMIKRNGKKKKINLSPSKKYFSYSYWLTPAEIEEARNLK